MLNITRTVISRTENSELKIRRQPVTTSGPPGRDTSEEKLHTPREAFFSFFFEAFPKRINHHLFSLNYLVMGEKVPADLI